MFQLHLVVTSTLLMFVLSATVTNGNNIDYQLFDFYKELPSKSDLFIFLESLKEIVLLCLKHKNDVDMNLEFGLFLASVNLKKALLSPKIRIPTNLKNNIIHLVNQNDELMEFFGHMLKYSDDRPNKIISSLFLNETQWIKQLRQFDLVLLDDSGISIKEPKEKSSSWQFYYENVADVSRWTPYPQLSDYCMKSLAYNRIHKSICSNCMVPARCYNMLINGTDFGYALTHRLLFLLNARHSRGCIVFSKEQDEALVHNICKVAFDEAKFIAMNDYGLIDLILEQMCLCSTAGYPQFLRRSWLADILRYQTKYGCFGQTLPQETKYSPSFSRHLQAWKLSKDGDYRMMDGQCDSHLTSVAAATLASAIRFILETQY